MFHAFGTSWSDDTNLVDIISEAARPLHGETLENPIAIEEDGACLTENVT